MLRFIWCALWMFISMQKKSIASCQTSNLWIFTLFAEMINESLLRLHHKWLCNVHAHTHKHKRTIKKRIKLIGVFRQSTIVQFINRQFDSHSNDDGYHQTHTHNITMMMLLWNASTLGHIFRNIKPYRSTKFDSFFYSPLNYGGYDFGCGKPNWNANIQFISRHKARDKYRIKRKCQKYLWKKRA